MLQVRKLWASQQQQGSEPLIAPPPTGHTKLQVRRCRRIAPLAQPHEHMTLNVRSHRAVQTGQAGQPDMAAPGGPGRLQRKRNYTADTPQPQLDVTRLRTTTLQVGHAPQPSIAATDGRHIGQRTQLQAQVHRRHTLLGNTSRSTPAADNWQQPLQQCRTENFVQQLTADTSQWALKPDDPEILPAMCADFFSTLEHAHAASTVGNDKYAWKFWEKYCKMMGTTPIRSDVAAVLGLDAFGHQRERYLFANAVIQWMPTIKGRNGRVQGTPESCGKRIDAVNRVLQRLGLPTMPRKIVSMTIKAEMRKYALKHGPEWLQPQRKDPMPYSTVHAMLVLCLHTAWSTVLWTPEATQSLKALIHTMAETGMRKAEVTSERARKFTNLDLSFDHLKWLVNGGHPQGATTQLLQSMVPGRDFAVLYPNAAKADPFAMHWGNKPIFMLYDPTEDINAATALRKLELMCLDRVRGKRRESPLFFNSDWQPFTGSALDKVLREMMAELVQLQLVTKEQTSHYSWHSFRASLATALLQAGASGPQIQACCRWLSEKSVPIYAAFTAEAYSALVRKAMTQDVSTALRSHRPGEVRLQSGMWVQYDDSQHVQALLEQQ